jgi:hypothetical protein
MTRPRSFRGLYWLRAAALLGTITFVNCKEGGVTDAPLPVTTIEVNQTSLNMRVGETTQLSAVPKGGAGQVLTGRAVTFTSGNNAVATITAGGLITAMGDGSTTITAQSGGVSASVSVTVSSVVNVQVTPPNPSVNVGQTQQLTATARNAAGNAVAGKTFAWSSSNPSVATVDPGTGVVRGLAAGSAIVTATTDGRSGTANVTVTAGGFVISVTNRLIHSVRLVANGVAFDNIPGATTRNYNVPAVSSFVLEWSLNRPTTTTGTAIGETMGGVFAAETNPTGTIQYDIDNEVGTTVYFAPLITNSAAVGLLMAVNFGFTAEVRCNCVAPAGSTRVSIGYYRLFSNTNVRGFRDGSNYTGNFVFWNFGQQFTLANIATGSGTVELPNSITPSTAGPMVGDAVPVPLDNLRLQLAPNARRDQPRNPER